MIDRCPRLFIPRNEISSGLTYDLIKISRQPVAGRFAFFPSFFFSFFSLLFLRRDGFPGEMAAISFLPFFFPFFFFAAIIGFRAMDEIGDGSERISLLFLTNDPRDETSRLSADFHHHFVGLSSKTIFFSFCARHICKFPRARKRMNC